MVVGPLAWDGSEVLPGESLSRHKRARGASSAGESFSSPAAELGPVVEETASAPVQWSNTRADSTPSLPVAEFEEPSLVQHETTLEEPSLVQHATAVEEPSLVQHDTAPVEVQEFEPSEASASYRVDPASPSAYRQSSVAEPPATEPTVEAETAPEQESESLAEQREEADSQLEPFFGEAASIVERVHVQETAPVEAVHGTSSATEENSTEAAESAQDEEEESDHDDHVFDPGLGNRKKKQSTKKSRKDTRRKACRTRRSMTI